LASLVRVCAVLSAGALLSGCAIGRLSTSRQDDMHQGLRDRAEGLSRTAWESVKSSSSHLSAWATILMEGSSKPASSGLAASSQGAPATSYLELKSRECNTDAERLAAVVTDVKAKTDEADAFIAFAQSVRQDAQARIAAQQAWAPSAEVERQRRALAEDKRVLEQAVADLRQQKATFAEVERELRAAARGLDTSPLKAALAGFGQRISRLSALALEMDA
jgi:hypothetical protein